MAGVGGTRERPQEGFDAVLSAKKASHEAYDGVVEGLRSRDARYHAAGVTVQG